VLLRGKGEAAPEPRFQLLMVQLSSLHLTLAILLLAILRSSHPSHPPSCLPSPLSRTQTERSPRGLRGTAGDRGHCPGRRGRADHPSI
jgi:hypothetical protein